MPRQPSYEGLVSATVTAAEFTRVVEENERLRVFVDEVVRAGRKAGLALTDPTTVVPVAQVATPSEFQRGWREGARWKAVQVRELLAGRDAGNARDAALLASMLDVDTAVERDGSD
jgi:hypothetical protein